MYEQGKSYSCRQWPVQHHAPRLSSCSSARSSRRRGTQQSRCWRSPGVNKSKIENTKPIIKKILLIVTMNARGDSMKGWLTLPTIPKMKIATMSKSTKSRAKTNTKPGFSKQAPKTPSRPENSWGVKKKEELKYDKLKEENKNHTTYLSSFYTVKFFGE